MRILIATDAYYPPNVSGVAYFSYRLASELAHGGNEVFVIAPSRKLENTITRQDGVTIYGVASVALPVYNKFRISPMSLVGSSIDRIVKEINPEVVHIQNHFIIGKLVVDSARKYGIPIVGTNHFMPENLVHYLHLPKVLERKLIRLAWKQFVNVYSKADYVTTPTKSAAKLLKDVGLHKEVIPISCGIDLERFTPKNNGGYLIGRYGIPKDVKILLYVGRLDKEKNVDVIIRSLPKILNVEKLHLVIAGTGGLRTKLQTMVQEMGLSRYVTFTGFVVDKDLPNLYAIADIFIAPGVAELQCITALEALATGLPLVAANAMALPELVNETKNGFLFTPGDHNSLADGVIKILDNRNSVKKMGDESLRMAKNHDIRTTVSKFESLYQKAIALKGKH